MTKSQQLVTIAETLGYARGVLESQTDQIVRQRLRETLWRAQLALVDMLSEPDAEQS